MAEAAVDHPIFRFFCHQCTQEINPVLPDYICPRCRSGFIEELGQSYDTPSDTTDEEFEPTINIEQLWGQLFSDLEGNPDVERRRSMRQRSRSRRYSNRGVNRGQEANRDQSQSSQNNPNPRSLYYRIRNQFNSSLPVGSEPLSMEEIIQQIITTLSGAAGVAGNTGFPILLNLHGNPGDYAWGRGGLDTIISQLLNQMDDGSGPPPLSKDVISQIPTVAISKEQVAKALQCTVCMEDFKVGESVRKLQCTHHFHHNCIVPWLELHGTCPICRTVFSNDDNEMEHEYDSRSGSTSSSSSYTSNSDSNPSSSSSSNTSNNSSSANSSSTSSSSSQYSDYPNPSSVYDFNEEVD